MANPTIRMFAMYFDTKKAATVNQVSVDINPNRSAMFGQEGYAGHSTGALLYTFTVNEVTPVSGSTLSNDLILKILNRKAITAGVQIGGQTHEMEVACTACNFKSQSENGMADGTATFVGSRTDFATAT